MSDYSITLFLHIAGALVFFAVLVLEWTGLSQIRSAMTLAQVRAWMGILKEVRKFGFASMATTVITGIYLMLRVWGVKPWLIVTLGSLVLVIALAQVFTAPRMAAIGQALFKEKEPFSSTFHSLAYHPLLSISIQIRAAIVLGIVFLKIAKPDLGGSLLTIGIAIVLGLASALPFPLRRQAQEKPAE